MRRIIGCLVVIGVLLPGKGWGQSVQPLSCAQALYLNNAGHTQELIKYATQLYENWNDQAMQAGHPTPSSDGAAGAVRFALRVCSGGDPSQQFEDGVRAAYQMAQRF